MAEPTAPLPPIPAADDGIRKAIAWGVLITCFLTVLGVFGALIYFGKQLPQDVMTIVAALAGTVIGNYLQQLGTVLGYLFGSSSGSTSKNQ